MVQGAQKQYKFNASSRKARKAGGRELSAGLGNRSDSGSSGGLQVLVLRMVFEETAAQNKIHQGKQ